MADDLHTEYGTIDATDTAGVYKLNVNATVSTGTAAGDLGKAEDAAHSSGDVGVMVLAYRNDNQSATLSGTDGDYEPLQVGNGALYTQRNRAGAPDHPSDDWDTVVSAGTAVTLTALSASQGFYVKALATNVGNVYVGASDVDATQGYVLAPGESTGLLPLLYTNETYIDADVSGEGVAVLTV